MRGACLALFLCGAGFGQASDLARAGRVCQYVRIAGRILADAGEPDPAFQPAVDACKAMEASRADAAAEVLAVADRLQLTVASIFHVAESAAPKLAGEKRFYDLADLAKTAVDADELEKAQTYARELLRAAPNYPKDWNYGNAIYYGNFVIGRVALRQGNIPVARQYLLNASTTPGSPQLNSFGPNMTLAKELLEKQQADVVLQFFSACGNFWSRGRDRLTAWTVEVRRGSIPDFGANLNY